MTNIEPPMEHFERPDPALTNKIVTHLKSQGIFDQFRRECMADVDTKPAYHNLRQRVENSVATFLQMNPWRPDMNKNQIRDNLRKHIQSGGFLDIGVDRIVDQVVNPKIYTVFLPKVEEVVQSCLGMENDKPKFEPPPAIDVKSEPSKFQDKHNLAPRAKLPAPLIGPMIKPLNPDQAAERSSSVEEKLTDHGVDTDMEETGDKKYVVDEDDMDEKEEEEEDDDEESPPFEPHSEGDRLILGMRSDSSENSNDSQVVTTTIVSDNLEERIDDNETGLNEESDKKDEDSSSDEYVPKTPTINMEESDGTVLEFNSISEYKQYQTKFQEDSLGNIEEVVVSQCGPVKEERSSNVEDCVGGPQKRKFNSDSYDEASNSSNDQESTSDEIKPAVFESFAKKRFKLTEYDHDHETSELSTNDAENEDSYTERSLDMTDSKLKVESEQGKHKGDSASFKDSGKNDNIREKDHRESSHNHSSKDRTVEREHQEKSGHSHSSKDKKDTHKKSDKNESSKDHHKERDRKRSESSSKHQEKDQSKHSDKEKKRSKSSERSKKDKDTSKSRKESRHEQKDHHNESKSRVDNGKEKKKHSSRDRHTNGKEDHDLAHKNDKDKREDSKHDHSSSKSSHRSSSEKHKSGKDHKHRESFDRHKSHDKKLDKDSKDDSKKKYREHCKYNTDKDENRRSSDRDSSGPSERSHVTGSSKSRPSRTNTESKVETEGKTTSSSDNTVSDNIESPHDNLKLDNIDRREEVPSEFQSVETIEVDSAECNSSKEEYQLNMNVKECMNMDFVSKIQSEDGNFEHDQENYDSPQPHAFTPVNHTRPQSDVSSAEKDIEDVINQNDMGHDTNVFSVTLHDSSSEKENIEQDTKEQINSEPDGNSTDASVDEDSTVVKFKKPKIAKNIHEVKKIMEARRHLKRMEKKRLKLLMKNNTEGYESDEKSTNGSKPEDGSQEDIFKGFEGDISLDKIKKYDCLVKRLESETVQLEKSINSEQINSSLITSWINLDPEFDVYIENTLKGIVHRSYRVHLPPICDENYTYDAEHNVYHLIENSDDQGDKAMLVDSNLNNLSSIYSASNQQENISSCNDKPKRRKLEEKNVSCSNKEILCLSRDYLEQNSEKHELSSDDDLIVIPEEGDAPSISGARRVGTDIIAPPVSFSLTFNQTYDEVLKEKAQNSVVPNKKEIEEINKTPLTVVKITNNKTSEQVFMKKIHSDTDGKTQVPRISKSDTVVNGKVIENTSDSKKIPLISRITKTKNNSHQVNGIMTSDSRSNLEEDYSIGVSRKIINDVIGIQHLSCDQGETSDHSSQSGEEASEHRRRRRTGSRQQRYDSSDLYKPRPQLSSRRVRGVGSSPEEPSVPVVIVKRKRSATPQLDPTPAKRRR